MAASLNVESYIHRENILHYGCRFVLTAVEADRGDVKRFMIADVTTHRWSDSLSSNRKLKSST